MITGGRAELAKQPERLAGLAVRTDLARMLGDAMCREDLEPVLVGADEDDHHRIGAVFLAERDRRLVAMVTVGDQQLLTGESAGNPGDLGRIGDLPEPGA